MIKQYSRRQFIKTSAIGLAAAGTIIVTGKIISEFADSDMPHPYPVMPDKKPVILPPAKPPLFFNEHQYSLVATLAALIVPTDKDPGATEAGAADYIDRMVSESEEKQKQYAKGLDWIDNAAKKQYGNNFLELSVKEQIELLTIIDEEEKKKYRQVQNYFDRVNRKIDELWIDGFGLGNSNRFFHIVCEDVFYGYYSNPISWKVVGYYGPPQPVGYPDYAEPPSSEKYINTIRPIKNNMCQNCHFDMASPIANGFRMSFWHPRESEYLIPGLRFVTWRRTAPKYVTNRKRIAERVETAK